MIPMATKAKSRKRDSAGGTYVYNERLGKVVKVSDRVPKVASKGKGRSSEASPCGRSVCGGGRCAGMS